MVLALAIIPYSRAAWFSFQHGRPGCGNGLVHHSLYNGRNGRRGRQAHGRDRRHFRPKGILIASIMVILAGGVYGLILMALNPRYAASFLKRIWMTLKTLVLTRQFILIPPDKDTPQPVLKYAIPIAIGTLGYMLMLITGYDLFPELLGDQFKMFSIALSKGGT
jgi:hypothetical protein